MESGGEIAKKDPMFTLDSIMDQGWTTFKRFFWSFLGILSLGGFLAILPHMAGTVLDIFVESSWITITLGLLLWFAGVTLSLFVQLGVFNLQIKAVNGENLNTGQLWEPMGRVWAYLGAAILFGLMFYIGLIFFVVPGIYFYLTFQFYPFFIVEHKMGPIQALQASAAITEGNKWELLFLSIILGFINSVGFCLLLIGMIPTKVYDLLVVAQTYKQLHSSRPQVSMESIEVIGER